MIQSETCFVFYDENSTQFQYLVKSAEHRVRHVIVDHDGRDEHFVEIDSVGPYCLVDGIGRVVIGRCWTAARRTRVRSIRPQYKETSKSTRIVRPSAVSFKSVKTHNKKSGEPPPKKEKRVSFGENTFSFCIPTTDSSSCNRISSLYTLCGRKLAGETNKKFPRRWKETTGFKFVDARRTRVAFLRAGWFIGA